MLKFIDYLISIGYIPYRFNLTKREYVPVKNYNSFSSYSSESLSVHLILFNSTFVFGLSERGMPPTLISPRPNRIFPGNDINDHFTNKFISDNSVQKCYRYLVDKSIRNP